MQGMLFRRTSRDRCCPVCEVVPTFLFSEDRVPEAYVLMTKKSLYNPVKCVLATLFSFALCNGSDAVAQVKPASSGQPSFYEPEMRRVGEGFIQPNVGQMAPSAKKSAEIKSSTMPIRPVEFVGRRLD